MARERTLGVSFETSDALQLEFESNLSNGGIFVATEEALELREQVQVRIGLDFVREHVMLLGEVVHVVPPELAEAGARPGVALQLLDNPLVIRERFGPYLGGRGEAGSADETIPSAVDPGARRARRKRARIDARIASDNGSLDGRTRDLSRSGALVGVDRDVAVGEEVKLTLKHPSTGEELAVDGRVVRQVESGGSGVSAVAIEFDQGAGDRDVVERFVDDVQRVEHTRRMGGIAGPIEELGPHAVLQMFASTAPAGTLYLRRGQEEGVIGFESGLLRVVRIGSLEGMAALVELMGWTGGSFEFHARFESRASREAPLPLEAAVLDALRQLDEARPLDPARFPLHGKLRQGLVPDGYDPSKVEAAVLDLASVGFSIERVIEVIPEPDPEIFRALANLSDAGLVRVEE